MTAKYFYEILCNYNEISKKNNKYWDGYNGGTVNIHHRGEEHIFYTVSTNGNVVKQNLRELSSKLMRIEDLDGDFELYSHYSIVKCGFVTVKNLEYRHIKTVITNLCELIDENSMAVCSNYFKDGFTDDFSYYSVEDMQCSVKSIHRLTKENETRRFYMLDALPYPHRRFAAGNSFFVAVSSYRMRDDKKAMQMADKTISGMMEMLKNLEYDVEWNAMNVAYTLYA